MKKTFFMLGLLSVVALASCDKREDSGPKTTPDSSFRGMIEEIVPDVSSKAFATVDDNSVYHLFWNRGDRVSIFYTRTYNRQYEFLDRDGTTAGEFERVGTDPAHITEQDIETGFDYAIYPYDRDNACSTTGKLTVVIPERQEFYNDKRGVGVRPLMVAQSATGDFFFMHAGAYLGIMLKGDGVAVKSITFQGKNSEIIAGYPEITFVDGEPTMRFKEEDLDNGDTITMEFDTPVELDADTEKLFWLNLPAITLENGFNITVKTPSGGSYTREIARSFTFKRKTFYKISAEVVIESTPVSSVSLDKEELTLNVGEEKTLVATVLPEDADDRSVTWSSSDGNVATVDTDGKVTAVAAGTADITVTTNDGSKTAVCAVTVNDVISYSMTITPAEAEINALDQQDYTVTLTTVKNGVSTDSQVEATLTSSDTDVATVSGLTATGVKGGTATITASYTPEGSSEAVTAEASLTVKDVISYSLSIDPEEASEIIIGSTREYILTLTTTTNGVDATSVVTADATWSSSEDTVATVSAGTATGVKEGTVTITATYTTTDSQELIASAELTVNKKPNQAGDPTPIEDDVF